MEKAGEQFCGFSYRPHFLDLIGAGGLPEEEARELAYRLVKRAREEGGKLAAGANRKL